MPAISIPKKEYADLVEKKIRYEQIRQIFEEDIFSPPPTKSAKEIVSVFKATGKYNEKFLKNLASGLKRSSYFVA